MNSEFLAPILIKYKELLSQYDNLGQNITQALELLLKENKISYLSINYRIKEVDSFSEKINRKKYINPIDEIEDICGVRIICYYQSDIEKIKEIVKREFEVTENVNKVDNLEYDQFGYRSLHSIIKVKNEWHSTPNYRGLENLKTELQIRTVLMHAWAEIEHKLAYKSKSQIPKEFQRKLARISAKLEESDEQFEEIKNQIEENKEALIKSAFDTKIFKVNAEFNLDTLQAFLDYAFPNRIKDIKATSALFEEMVEKNIGLKDLVDGYEKSKQILNQVEREMKLAIFSDSSFQNDDDLWVQVGAARFTLELTTERFFDNEIEYTGIEIIRYYRNIISNENVS